MSDIYAKLAQLSPERRALFEKKLAEQGLAPKPQGIPRRPADAGPLPLSFAQRRLWFMQQLDPTSTAYNMMTVLRFRGALNVAALENALRQLLTRHEALRTRFTLGADGEPVQIIDETPDTPLTQVDVSAASDPEAAARAAVSDVTGTPYDLSHVPVRTALIRLSAEDHVLAFGLHHIAGDRWSLGLLVRDLAVLFDAARKSQPSPLPELSLQAPDWAYWQRQTQEEAVADQLTYWTGQLAGVPKLDLSFDHARGPKPGVYGAQFPFALDPDLEATARRTAQAKGVSLFTLLLAAFNVLMHRYTGADDIPVGSEVANRDRPELQGMMGALVNTLVMRSDLSGDPGFNAVLTRVAETARQAMAHQDVPFEQVVEAVNPERQMNEMMPLFQAKFDLQQASKLPKKLGDLGIERFPYGSGAAKYELRFNFEDHGDRLEGRVEYCSDLFEEPTIARMTTHFMRLLRAQLDAPDTPISRLPMMDDTERKAALDLADGPALMPLPETTVHAAFEAQVKRTPDAVALRHNGVETTYAQLNAKANGIAAALIERGVDCETCVGICMARSVDMMAAVMGVLKAGGAYVPLDPNYPAERIGFIAEDTAANIILTDGRLLPFDSARPVELIDATQLPDAETPAPRGDRNALAVIVYTSGSTGKPKGVALEHRSILARTAWGGADFSAEELSGVLFATSICFDLSIFEMFVTLSHGGTLILIETLMDLPKLPTDAGVTLVNTVPSLMRELLKHHDLPDSVRVVNHAGEFLPPVLHERLQSHPHLKRINNLWGPTEDTIYSSGNNVRDWSDLPLPIGCPLPGTRVYVLDKQGQLLPNGLPGEIYVAGEGLARGYLNRPEKTAETFVSDPYQDAPGAIMYKTGDRGYWRADGRIGILGRIDTQVKVRGLRIEIGEIETALETHDNVAEAFVMALGEPSDPNRYLAAYVTPPAGGRIDADTLRTYLSRTLPAHMIPARWRIMERLPRMPNGKVDRKALTDLDVDAPGRHYTAPRNDAETRICMLWSGILDVEQVGIDDNFFELGGHSLIAMRLLIELQNTFETDLTIAQLFRALTPRAQGELIEQVQGQKAQAIPAASDAQVDDLGVAEVDALLAQMMAE